MRPVCVCVSTTPRSVLSLHVPVVSLTAIIDNIITLQPKNRPTTDTEEAPTESSVYPESPLVP